ncbi:MAG TPA: alpha-amylase family glycosyl hydrolase [Candidatus Paceibacterota bacterium]|nr:alpha-amylase family glycosyl hydrolase [Candidatus Paceibacterota bacterium]
MQQPTWWMNAKIYELYVDKFAEDFKGLTEKLDYFTHLGINTLHILPHYTSPMVDDGYDVSDYRTIRPELGTMDDFRAFADAAHKRGIRIIIDFVLNHVSEKHEWFVEARSSKQSRTRDFFIWSPTGRELADAPNPFRDFKASNWIWNEATGDYYYATFYPQQPDLNWGNPIVFAEMVDIMDFWVAAGTDGFRLDAVPLLFEQEETSSVGLPATHSIIAALRQHLDNNYGGRIVLLAEVVVPAAEAVEYFGDGRECQMVYHFQLAAEMFLSMMRHDRSQLDTVVQETFSMLPTGAQWATFLRNHDDLNLGMIKKNDRYELIQFLDPEGKYLFNKGCGVSVRLGTIFQNAPERIVEAHELLYSLPGAPILYYGDEIGMQNLPGSSFTDTRRYVRGPFDWNTAESMRADQQSTLNRIARLIHDHHGVR